jgi:PTS system sucrose-specific IIC component
VQAAFAVGATTMGISGLPLVAVTTNMPIYFLGLVVSYIVGFIATWILGFDDPQT